MAESLNLLPHLGSCVNTCPSISFLGLQLITGDAKRINPRYFPVLFSLTAKCTLRPTGRMLTCDEVIASSVSQISVEISHTSISISFGCMEKSENRSSSGGNKKEPSSAKELSF